MDSALVERHTQQLRIYENDIPDSFRVMNCAQPQPNIVVHNKEPLKSMMKICIRDLKLERVMKSCYLCVQIALPSCRGPSLYLVIQDENKDVIEASLCNLPATFTFKDGQQYLPLGQWVCIKNPFYKTYKTGVRGLRIEDKQDLIIIQEYQAKQILGIPITFTALQFKEMGNENIKSKQYLWAYENYTQAINLSDNLEFKIICLNNRAFTLLQLNYNQECLTDLQQVLDFDPTNVKALYRKAQALLKLNKPSECRQILESIKDWNKDPLIIGAIVTCEQMKKYQDNKFDIIKLVQQYIKGEEVFEQSQQYIGPFERRQSKIGGLGMIATADIVKGQILIIEKPLHTVSINWDSFHQQQFSLVDQKPVDYIQQAFVFEMRDIAQNNLQIAQKLFQLYDGTPNYGVRMIQPDFEYSLPRPEINMERIDKIFKLNGHAFQKNKSDIFKDDKLGSLQLSKDQGLWFTLSQINHSCRPNCIYYFIGQLLVLVSVKEIKAGEELLLQYAPCLNLEEYEQNLHTHEIQVENFIINEYNKWECSEFKILKKIEKVCLKKNWKGLLPILKNFNAQELDNIKQEFPFIFLRITQLISYLAHMNNDFDVYIKYKLMNLHFQYDTLPQCQVVYDIIMVMLIAMQHQTFSKELTQVLFRYGILFFGVGFIQLPDCQELLFQYSLRQANIEDKL